MIKIKSLFGKIFASHIALILLFSVTLSLFLSQVVTEYLIENKRGELYRDGLAATRFIESIGGRPDLLPPLLDNLGQVSGARLWLVKEDGTVLSDDPRKPKHHRYREKHHMALSQPMYENIQKAFQTHQAQSWVQKTPQGGEDPSIFVAIPLNNNDKTVLFMRTPIQGLAKASDAISLMLCLCVCASLLLAAGFAFLLSRNLTRPIASITKAAQAFSTGKYNSRTTAVGEDEIGVLGHTFNKMAEHLSYIEKNRQEFYSDVTHELKTPLASIQALTESLLDGLITEESKKKRYLETIINETERMNELISGLLTLARMEAEQQELHPEMIALDAFTDQLKTKYSSLLAEKNLLFAFYVEKGLKKIFADRPSLDRIFDNLISNAIRHAFPASTIQISFKKQPANLLIAVENAGDTIPEHDLKFIWNRFYRVDKSRSRSQGGTGLGLAITKKLVERMGGDIQVASENNLTIFTFHLPEQK